jgi:hypothetical protein
MLILPGAAIAQHGPRLPVMTDTAVGKVMLVRFKGRPPAKLSIVVLAIQAIAGSNEHRLSAGSWRLFNRDLLAPAHKNRRGRSSRGPEHAAPGERASAQCRGTDQMGRAKCVRFGMLAVITQWFGLRTTSTVRPGWFHRNPGSDIETC